MTLASRLTFFFLGLLAVVLIAFSACLFFAARSYLLYETDATLTAALNTVVAAIEVVPEGVEWEPSERNLTLRSGPLGQQVRWVLIDDRGRIVDRSAELPDDAPLVTIARRQSRETRPVISSFADHGRCRLAQQWLAPARLHPELPYRPDADFKFPALGVSAAISLEPVYSTSRRLAIALIGIGSVIWVAGLLIGRAVCRRALRPVSQLAAAAGDMNVSDLSRRLPTIKTADELESLARAFNGLLDRLEESFERQRRFTGDASHQLRTPLTVMRGQVEVALRRDRSPDDYRKTLENILREATQLHQLVESLLFLARANGDAQLAQRTPIEIGSFLSSYLGKRSDSPRADDIQLTLPSNGDVWIAAQAVLLEQLLDIVIDNACKFSSPGTSIQVRANRDQAQACISIHDCGVGIEPSEISKLFDPFHRAPHAIELGVPGHGLGLAIAQRLAAALGGKIVLTSQQGLGTTVTLRFPAIDRETGEPFIEATCRPSSEPFLAASAAP